MKKSKKRYSKPKRSKVEITLIACLSLLIVLLAGLIVRTLLKGDSEELPSQNDPNTSETEMTGYEQNTAEDSDWTSGEYPATEPEETRVSVYSQLPYLLEEGKLEIESIFQYSGINPDADWQEAVNTGALVLNNVSEEYLELLELEIELSDGTLLKYFIQDIPAGKSVCAFDLENTAYSGNVLLASVGCKATFRGDSGITSDVITVSTDGMQVELKNISDEDLHNLEIRCHSVSGDDYFCGASHTYPVERIAAGETVIVIAEDCVFGDVEVTIIDYAN